LRSNSLDLGFSHYLNQQTLASFAFRRYDQTGTFFYQPQYDTTPQFFTADFRLAPFASNLFTGALILSPKSPPWMIPKGASLILQYERYRADNGFEAGTFTAGA